MDTTQLLREQLHQAHAFLTSAVTSVTDAQARWVPPGLANPLGATYAHVLFGEDAFISNLAGRVPLFASGWAERTGVSEAPPLAAAGSPFPLAPEWFDWGRRVRVDLPALRHYDLAVQQATDSYLAPLRDDDLTATLDLSEVGFGQPTLAWVLSAGLVGHALAHWGEIVCLKGLQGERGFPV
jgi:hypothetical protein